MCTLPDLYQQRHVFQSSFNGNVLFHVVIDLLLSFHTTLYQCPETSAERREMALGVMTRIEDLTMVTTYSFFAK